MELVEVLKQFGFPVAVVAAGFMALWRFSVWVGEHVLKPLVTSHVEMVKELNIFTVWNRQAHEAHLLLLHEIVAMQREHKRKLDETHEVISELAFPQNARPAQ